MAIDWSGAISGAAKKIWLAESRSGQLVRLECGRDRDQIAALLIDEARQDPALLVGLDFAFSLPAWYLAELGLASAHDLWALADRDAERWLTSCQPPFWGRLGRGKPDLVEHFRRTERDVPTTAGISPKSVFQIGGAGAVGTGSLRGMRLLHRLSDAGFSVWPFDLPSLPCVIEIYPRPLTGPVKKSDPAIRAQYLAIHFPALDPPIAQTASSSEDAFDAAACSHWRHLPTISIVSKGSSGILRRDCRLVASHSVMLSIARLRYEGSPSLGTGCGASIDNRPSSDEWS
jgi:hypothetical protein